MSGDYGRTGRRTETFRWRDTEGKKDKDGRSECVNNAGCWNNGKQQQAEMNKVRACAAETSRWGECILSVPLPFYMAATQTSVSH